MKRVTSIAVKLLFVLAFAVPAFGQAAAPTKIGVINTEYLYVDKVGITKILTAADALEKEFAPKQQELQTMANKLQTLAKEIETLTAQLQANPKAPVGADAIVSKREEGERLQIDFKRKEEDAKAAYARREAVVMGPIRREIGNALQEYAKTKGFSIVLDGASMEKNAMLLAPDKTVDITEDFVKYFNTKPATTASAAAKP